MNKEVDLLVHVCKLHLFKNWQYYHFQTIQKWILDQNFFLYSVDYEF